MKVIAMHLACPVDMYCRSELYVDEVRIVKMQPAEEIRRRHGCRARTVDTLWIPPWTSGTLSGIT